MMKRGSTAALLRFLESLQILNKAQQTKSAFHTTTNVGTQTVPPTAIGGAPFGRWRI